LTLHSAGDLGIRQTMLKGRRETLLGMKVGGGRRIPGYKGW
jgi:hypothetical protein